MSTIASVFQPYSSATVEHITASRSQSADITIVTAEGDRVTLSASMGAQAEYAPNEYATYNAYGRVSVTIEGDLSRSELKDIRKAIRTIEKAARDMARGDE